MDPEDALRLLKPAQMTRYWQSNDRRDHPEGDWYADSDDVRTVSRYYEEIGDDLRRHQRLAVLALYEC